MELSNYTIKHPIGQGGMAVVYLAEHNILQKPVAIKMLNKEFVHNDNIRKRFLAEAKNLFGMSHPNIIKVTDLIDEGDTVAFVMEYIQGESLKEYLNNKGKLSVDKIKDIFSQMLDGVGYVHEQNLVHRDIKPSNFMISQNGQIKLLDFGIAKNTDKQSSDYTQTGTTQSMGTPMYMSPEQVKSTKDVTLQSDIYSLGVVLWQMVMGVKPYDTNTTSTFELQTKIVTEKLRLTGTSFDKIIEVATAKEINNRYKNCKEIKSKLDNLQKQDSDNTKVYTAQESEKTIVDNTFEKTEIESTLGNKSISKPNISQPYVPIPPNKPKTSPALFIVLGFVIIVILGIIISNNNSYTPDPYDYTADSTAVFVDSTAIVADTSTFVPDSAPAKEEPIGVFYCNDGKEISYSWVNDGTCDCNSCEDEGVAE
jgi:serine/threonine-protein kinase